MYLVRKGVKVEIIIILEAVVSYLYTLYNNLIILCCC